MNRIRNKGVLIATSGIILLSILMTIRASGRAKSAKEYFSREYGVGVVAYEDMPSYSAKDTIYAEPDSESDIVAVLDARELCFAIPIDTCVFSFQRMIEYDYEIGGFAILAFNTDSNWAEVTLDPYNRLTPQTGWIDLMEPKVASIFWSDSLPEKNSIFFLDSSSIRFFTGPDYSTEVTVVLEAYSNSPLKYDYEMHPLAVEARWMKVEVLSPSQYCRHPTPDSKVDTVWIEYLNEELRPNVFYYPRGC